MLHRRDRRPRLSVCHPESYKGLFLSLPQLVIPLRGEMSRCDKRVAVLQGKVGCVATRMRCYIARMIPHHRLTAEPPLKGEATPHPKSHTVRTYWDTSLRSA